MKEKTIYALGFFDGVHLGHQALLRRCKEMALCSGCKTGVVTFIGHPDTLVTGSTPQMINTRQDRKKLLQQFHIDTVLELPFDEKLMQMAWESFAAMLIAEHGATGFVCGEDFRFGSRGEGTPQLLQEMCRKAGLCCAVVPQQKLDGVTVSSTHIRKLLEAGKMEQAVHFLGHPHVLTGTVVPGQQIGKPIGIPTANLHLPKELVQPKKGVYACRALADGTQYLAVTNVGTRPTVGGEGLTVEAWLLDFEGDLYEKELTIQFFTFLRQEQKFASLAQLQAEIQKNALQTRKILANS